MTFRRRFYVIIGVGLRFDDISPQYSIIFIQKNDTKKKCIKIYWNWSHQWAIRLSNKKYWNFSQIKYQIKRF